VNVRLKSALKKPRVMPGGGLSDELRDYMRVATAVPSSAFKRACFHVDLVSETHTCTPTAAEDVSLLFASKKEQHMEVFQSSHYSF